MLDEALHDTFSAVASEQSSPVLLSGKTFIYACVCTLDVYVLFLTLCESRVGGEKEGMDDGVSRELLSLIRAAKSALILPNGPSCINWRNDSCVAHTA